MSAFAATIIVKESHSMDISLEMESDSLCLSDLVRITHDSWPGNQKNPLFYAILPDRRKIYPEMNCSKIIKSLN